ncbi:MAG: hypothetical protein ACOYYI_12485 [Chloroflexota bacterium]
MSVSTENIFHRLARNAAQGKRKFVSLYRAHGLWDALRAAWRNLFLIETVCRLEKDLAIPDFPVMPAVPLQIETLNSASDLTTWQGRKEILALRGEYGMEQFHARLKRGDLCFTAYSEGGFAGFVWLEFPPGNEAGYPLQPHEAYTYDGWTFETFRGKRVLPVIQQSIMGYVRAHHANIRTLVTHVAVWNKPSLSGDQRAGYVLRRLERTVMILGVHRKQILSANIPAELLLRHNMP